ncbi:2505_t:CDS:2 [Diversispora eburnea]|uniref:2505_t:CDS:1 n=1 Tax=Diversispora eburnea TaxID=1213867 RepID=A0A9N8ZH13_9GLOM|nr:2505_t:CDS:2 [Diversispora eburnea]
MSKQLNQSKLHPEKSIKQHQFMFNSFPTVSNVTSQIILPFPPNISANEIADKRRKDQIMLKSPNAFMIYRMAFLDHLNLLNQNFKMTDVSKLVSIYWRNEPDTVKDAYKKIAHEVEQELNERRKKNVLFCRVSWKDSKFTKFDETLTFEYPNNFTFVPFSHEGTTSFNTSSNDINNFSTHETQINSIDNNNNPNFGYEFIEFDDINNCTDYLNFEYDNNIIDYYL